MNGVATKEAAEKWSVRPRQIQLLYASGRIPGAVRFGNAWVIPRRGPVAVSKELSKHVDSVCIWFGFVRWADFNPG